MITPKEGWMIDPANPNGVIPIGSISPNVVQPNYQNTVNNVTPTDVSGMNVNNPANKPVAVINPTTAPAKSPDGAVSSSDIANGSSSNTATNAAANALTPPTTNIQSEINDYVTKSNASLTLSEGALKGVFDASLAASNQQYAGLFAQLDSQHKTASQAANSLASQLNPYADPRISSATGGYLQTIDSKYQAQAASLTGQMNAAQAQLQAGYYQNYVNLVNDAQKDQQSFQTQMQQYGLDLYNSMKQAAQFDQSNALAQKTLANNIQNQSGDDFRSYLSTLSGSPELQADIKTYQETGKISDALQPIIKKGQDAGLSATEAVSIFQYQTDAVRKQQDLDDYRNQQLVLSQDRATAASNRQTNAQLAIATTNAVLAAQSDMRDKGIQPGTAEWATGVAAATGASSKGLTAGQVGKYTQMGVLANQLSGIKTDVDAVNAKDPLWNTLQTYAGRDVSSLSDTQLAALNAKLTSLSGVIGKTFYGESGNLSNSDIQRVLNALPTGAGTPALRTALYAGLLTVARDNAVTTLESDAQAGYQVATYADSVQKIANMADQALTSSGSGSSSSSSTTFDYAAWKKANGL